MLRLCDTLPNFLFTISETSTIGFKDWCLTNSRIGVYYWCQLLQGLVSQELPAYFSIFNQFKLNELWSYYQKHVNQIILNRTTL